MKKVQFEISYIDHFGQGVSKILDKVTLIPKSIPGEKGEADIFEEHSKWQKGEISELNSPSAKRRESPCLHFNQCSGCHYLMLGYEEEIDLKKQHFNFLFKKQYPNTPFDFFSAPERLGYRNRIQLHYDKTKQKIGFFDIKNKSIIEIPFCKIIEEKLALKLEELYQNNNWLKLVQDQPSTGHIELYLKENIVHTNINLPYAQGGFTQVYEKMNLLLIEYINQVITKNQCTSHNFLELFAGNGNLTHHLQGKSFCIDFYKELPQRKNSIFFNANLFSKDVLKKVKLAVNENSYPLLILDPPRSGFSDLKKWSDDFKCEFILYVSCNPQTLKRDIEELKNFELISCAAFDFFPATFHFETVMFFKRLKQ